MFINNQFELSFTYTFSDWLCQEKSTFFVLVYGHPFPTVHWMVVGYQFPIIGQYGYRKMWPLILNKFFGNVIAKELSLPTIILVYLIDISNKYYCYHQLSFSVVSDFPASTKSACLSLKRATVSCVWSIYSVIWERGHDINAEMSWVL